MIFFFINFISEWSTLEKEDNEEKHIILIYYFYKLTIYLLNEIYYLKKQNKNGAV